MRLWRAQQAQEHGSEDWRGGRPQPFAAFPISAVRRRYRRHTHDEVQQRAHHNPAGVVRREDTTADPGEFQGPEKLWEPQLKQRGLSAASSVGKTAELMK